MRAVTLLKLLFNFNNREYYMYTVILGISGVDLPKENSAQEAKTYRNLYVVDNSL